MVLLLMNTTDYLLQLANESTVAIITPKEEFTYGDIKRKVAYLVDKFLSLGAKPGDRIGILAPNSLFWVSSYLATLKIGAIAVPFATNLTSEEFQRNEDCVNCSILCIEERLFRKYSTSIPSDINVVIDQPGSDVDFDARDLHGSQEFDVNQDAAFMFTSGTTAYPRVVRITHRNIQANTESIINYLYLNDTERIMVILPFYYCFGTSLLHTHLRVGGTLVLPGPMPMVYPEQTLEMMEERECTGLAGVPSEYQRFLRNTTFPTRSLPNLRKIQQAGGKLADILIKELVDCRPNSQIFIMYGQTEATARLSSLQPSLVNAKMGSIGRGIPGVELKVIDEDGHCVSPGQVGEIIAKGDNISPGYLNEPEATKEKFYEGILKTGDLATVDEDGYIYIVDRKSDFIKSYGNRVSSQQIEACVLEIKDVVSAAAIGVPDIHRGEAIRVFVTLRSESPLTPHEIIEHTKIRLAPYMIPSEVSIINTMPTNAHGKVIKSELKKYLL